MEQIPPQLGLGFEYKRLDIDIPGVYYCFDKDPVHDMSEVRPQETLYLYIDKVDEAVIGITYDEHIVELYCRGLTKTDDVNRIMTKILGGMKFRWIN